MPYNAEETKEVFAGAVQKKRRGVHDMGKQKLQVIKALMHSGVGSLLELRKLRILFLLLKKAWKTKRKHGKKDRQFHKMSVGTAYRRHTVRTIWGTMRQVCHLFVITKKKYFS